MRSAGCADVRATRASRVARVVLDQVDVAARVALAEVARPATPMNRTGARWGLAGAEAVVTTRLKASCELDHH